MSYMAPVLSGARPEPFDILGINFVERPKDRRSPQNTGFCSLGAGSRGGGHRVRPFRGELSGVLIGMRMCKGNLILEGLGCDLRHDGEHIGI